MNSQNSKSICESEVFDSVFLEYSSSLRNFLYYKCGNSQQAEDWVQEVFIRLWQHCAKVPLEKAKSFLYTAAHNLFLNEVAHQKVIIKFQQNVGERASNPNPEFLMEEQEFLQQLEQAINALPEKQRTVFLLNRMDKKTYKEIAEMLNISVKAVEKRMSKALQDLRKLHKKI